MKDEQQQLQDETVDNRHRILLAAEALFADKGFAGTSVRDIVRRADVTAPVLYYYFGSKEELLHTLIRERFEQHLVRIEEALVDAQTVEDVVSCWFSAVMQGTTEHRTMSRLVLGAMWGPDVRMIREFVFEFRQKSLAVLTDALRKADPNISVCRAHFVYMALTGLVNVFVFPLLRFDVSIDHNEIRDAVVPRILTIIRDNAPLPRQVLNLLNTKLTNELFSDHSPVAGEQA